MPSAHDSVTASQMRRLFRGSESSLSDLDRSEADSVSDGFVQGPQEVPAADDQFLRRPPRQRAGSASLGGRERGGIGGLSASGQVNPRFASVGGASPGIEQPGTEQPGTEQPGTEQTESGNANDLLAQIEALESQSSQGGPGGPIVASGSQVAPQSVAQQSVAQQSVASQSVAHQSVQSQGQPQPSVHASVQSQGQQPGPQQWGKHDYTQAPAGFAGDWESLTEGARWKEWAKDSVRRQNETKLGQLKRFGDRRDAGDEMDSQDQLTNRLLSDSKTAAFWRTRLQAHVQGQQGANAPQAPDTDALRGHATANPGGARYWAGRVIAQAGGALANDERSAPESGAARTLHRGVQMVGRVGEGVGTAQDYSELGTAALNLVPGVDLPNYAGMAAANIGGIAQADAGALTSFKKHFGILNQAIGRSMLEGDPSLKSQIGREERRNAMWQDAIGSSMLQRARQANASDPGKAEMGNPLQWRSAVRRLQAKSRLGDTMEAHGMRSQLMLSQQESAGALGAQAFAETGNREAIMRTPNAAGKVVFGHGGGTRAEDASANPANLLPAQVAPANAGQRIAAGTASLFSGFGHALQGHSGRRALMEGDNLAAGAYGVAGMMHATGDAVFSAGMSEVPVVGNLTNTTYSAGTYVAGAVPRAVGAGIGAIGGSRAAVELERRDRVRKRFAQQVPDDPAQEFTEGDRKGAIDLGENPMPWQEEVRQRGLRIRPQGHAERRERARQVPLTADQLGDAAQGINRGGRRYRGDVRPREQLTLPGAQDPVALPEGTLPTGDASDAEAGWASRKRGRWANAWRGVKRAVRGTKPVRFLRWLFGRR